MSGFKGLFFKAMLAMAVFSVAYGCGGSKVEPQVAVVPAKGRVTIKGQPGANNHRPENGPQTAPHESAHF